jgi:hypothetical protein
MRAQRLAEVRTLQEFNDYRDPGGVKMAFNFHLEDAGEGSTQPSQATSVSRQLAFRPIRPHASPADSS